MSQVLYPTVWGEESKRLNYSVAYGNQFLWGVHLRQLRTKSSETLVKNGVCEFPEFSNIMSQGSLGAGYERICHPVYGHCTCIYSYSSDFIYIANLYIFSYAITLKQLDLMMGKK